MDRISYVIAGEQQALSDVEHLPERLIVLDPSQSPGVAQTPNSADSSFCTVAPLAFCEVNHCTACSLRSPSAGWPDLQHHLCPPPPPAPPSHSLHSVDRGSLSLEDKIQVQPPHHYPARLCLSVRTQPTDRPNDRCAFSFVFSARRSVRTVSSKATSGRTLLVNRMCSSSLPPSIPLRWPTRAAAS